MKTDRIIAGSLVGLCFASVLTGFIFQRSPQVKETQSESGIFSWSDSSFGMKKADIAVIEISGPIM